MNDTFRLTSAKPSIRRIYGKTAVLVALSGLMLALGACQSTRTQPDRMESKYSLKKRKSYISCIHPAGPEKCALPVRVKERAYREMVSLVEASRGTRYQYGGTAPDGFDCSGFVQYLYSTSFQMLLPRSSADLALLGTIVERRDLKRGDLLFFSSNGNVVDHVGIFLGDDRFAHASSSQGIAISTLHQHWYDSRFAFGTRIIRIE